MMAEQGHFNRKPRRRAEFIRPPHPLKAKVGSGGLSEEIISKAQKLLESSAADFAPLANAHLDDLTKAMQIARENNDPANNEALIEGILYPAMQLKANGGLFNFPLVTRTAKGMVEFLEVIDILDTEAIEIVAGFHATIKAVIMGRISGDGGEKGRELVDTFDKACRWYFEKQKKVK